MLCIEKGLIERFDGTNVFVLLEMYRSEIIGF
jgi:hypothetical protein